MFIVQIVISGKRYLGREDIRMKYEKPQITFIGTVNELVLGNTAGDVYEATPANETQQYYNPWS